MGIADILDIELVNSRQVLHRARAQIRARRARFEASAEPQRALLERFREATETGRLDAIPDLLAKDVVALTDGGAKARATLRPVQGRDRVARFVRGATRKFVPADVTSTICQINGEPALVSWPEGRPSCVIAPRFGPGGSDLS